MSVVHATEDLYPEYAKNSKTNSKEKNDHFFLKKWAIDRTESTARKIIYS